MGWVINVTPRPLYPKERDPVRINKRLGGPQGRCGRVRKILPTSGFDPQTVHHVSSCCIDDAIPVYNRNEG
jgi:hypothetical protein